MTRHIVCQLWRDEDMKYATNTLLRDGESYDRSVPRAIREAKTAYSADVAPLGGLQND